MVAVHLNVLLQPFFPKRINQLQSPAGSVVGRSRTPFATNVQEFPGSFDGYTEITDPYTSKALMRTNINIDDRLMRQAMRSSGAQTKRAAVEEGLRLLIQTRNQKSIRRLRGKVAWDGDLDASRLGRMAK